MLIPLHNKVGDIVGEVELHDSIYNAPINKALMHQALVRQLANARLGTHNTKTRGEVSGSTRKIWQQKHTGRARHGSIKANLFPGGGIIFGPKPRSYEQAMPRKMRRAAYRSALSVKARDGQIVVVDELGLEGIKTRHMIQVLKNLKLGGSVLVMLPEKDERVERSASNLPNVKTVRASYLNIRDLLGHDYLLIPQKSLAVIAQILG